MLRKPSKTCLLCDSTIEKIGGIRITTTNSRGVFISNEEWRESRRDPYPCRSYKFGNESYIIMRGPVNEGFNDELLEKAKQQFRNDEQPWLCQRCGHRLCSQCGEPMNKPPAVDYLCDDGSSLHIGIMPVDRGCINKKCDKYKYRSRDP